jgi:DNA-binding XRE family transcriptional regulator
MVSPSVRLFTESRAFESLWRSALVELGLDAELAAPESLTEALCADVTVVIDAGWSGFDEDELLAATGFARALGAVPVVALDGTAAFAAIAELLEELTGGLVARGTTDVARVVSALARRCDAARARRFEYLTVAPRGTDLLAILGDGRAALVHRPLSERDDGSEVLGITLADDAESAIVELGGGITIVVRAPGGASVPVAAPQATVSDFPLDALTLDGVHLGARLRALRVAAGLTQAELARRTGIHRPNIARVEAGRHTPSLETLSRLASAIGVPATRVLQADQLGAGVSAEPASGASSLATALGTSPARPRIGTK